MTEHPTALQVVDGIDLSGKTCVITGASSGLGRESARALAELWDLSEKLCATT